MVSGGVTLGFWLGNLNFALAALSFFAFFTAAWLVIDSWATIKRSGILLTRAVGFFLLASWAGLNGVLGIGVYTSGWLWGLLTAALVVVCGSFLIERLPGRPQELQGKQLAVFGVGAWSVWLAPMLGFVTAFRVWVQATKYIERSRKPLALAFGLLSLSWLTAALQTTDIATAGALSRWGEPFGVLWIASRLLEVVGSLFLLRWAWGFIRFRLFPQLYLTVVGVIVVVFVAVTIVFTTVLVQSVQQQTLSGLATNVRTFSFAVEELKRQTELTAQTIASRASLVQAAAANDPVAVQKALGDPIKDFRIGTVNVLNGGGELLTTVGTPARLGESFSDEKVAQQAFAGEIRSQVEVQAGPEVPLVVVRVGAPLVAEGKVVGAVLVEYPIDVAFVDRVKELTELEVTVYGGDQLAATTVRDEHGRPRALSQAEDAALTQTVIHEGRVFLGQSVLGFEPVLTAALPLRGEPLDSARGEAEKPVGILAVSLPQTALRAALDGAVRVTFAVSAGLLVLSLLPLYGVARVMTRYQSA